MSGICVVADLRGQPMAQDQVRAMAAAAPHRSTGGTHVVEFDNAVLLRQWRASDLHPRARPDGSRLMARVVADARIDNRRELQTALRRTGHLCQEEPSDEVLLEAAYAAWGPQCPSRVVGDFAFVVWDPRRRSLLAARDPLGMRSLFYRVEPGGRVLLATEVKQLLAVPGVGAEVFEPAAAADLVAHFGRPEWSFYEGISQLAPGWLARIDDSGCRLERFWDVDARDRIEVGVPEAAEAMRSTFVEAVAARLDDPRPTGILLSGGVDSGSVASAAGWLRERGKVQTPALHAFCWAFDRLPECDEREVSRHITDRYGIPVTEVPADDAGPLACYPQHLPDRDDPMLGAFQPLIEHSLAAARRCGVGVLLGGDRGDLVVGTTGLSYLGLALSRRWGDLQEALLEERRVLGDPWTRVAQRHLVQAVADRAGERSPMEWIARAARRARHRAAAPAPTPDWVRPSFLRRTQVDELRMAEGRGPAGLGTGRLARYRAITTPLHVRGVAWSERTYARHGIGFADPFSDRRVVELAVSLPPVVLNRPGEVGKPLMREAMRGVMPDQAVVRAAKVLPQPLFDDGLRDVADLVRTLLDDPQLEQRGWVDASKMRAHFEGWLGGAPLRAEFWWSLQVEIWLRQHW